MNFIGIDVGKNGGIASIDDHGKLTTCPIPKIGKCVDLHKLTDILKYMSEGGGYFCMEDVLSIKGSSAGSNFAFGENKGHIEGILVAIGASYQKVAPKTWQKVCWEGVPIQKKAAGGNDTKATSLIAAKRLFPGETFLATSRSSVPHDGLVDASLLAKYGQIKLNKVPPVINIDRSSQ